MQWSYYLLWITVASVVTFIIYGIDKHKSKRGDRRVPEVIFHMLVLAGGFPGGWAGRSVFRHKTRKSIFLLVIILSTILHLGLMLWILGFDYILQWDIFDFVLYMMMLS